MKKVSGFSLLSCVLCAALMLSCGSDNTATVKINIGLPKGVSAAPAHDGFIDRLLGFFVAPAYAQTAPEDVEAIGITVTGPNMVPFNKIYPADTTVVSLAINAGKKRRIAVRGIDNTGRPKYIGSRVVNLEAGSMQTVRIDMGENLHFIDINPESASVGSSPSGMTLYKNKVYFQGTTTETGAELWAYDLATDTASLVYDINQNVTGQDQTGPSSPTQLTVFDGKLYFSAYNGTGHNLWSYDGASDPVQLSNFTMTGIQPLGELTVVGDRLFFSAHDTGSTQTTAYYYTESDGVVEMQYDGSALHNDGYEFGFTGFGDAVCFGAYDGSNVSDCELFVYIFELGNAAKYDIYPYEDPYYYPSHPHDFVALNDVLYFAATDNLFGTDFHRLYGAYGDWLQEAINIGGEIESNPSELTVVGNFIYFSAQDYDANYELWRFNSLLPVLDGFNPSSIEIYEGSASGSNPSSLLAVGPVLFFAATDDSYGTSLWLHNSLNGTTQPISNLGETGMYFSSLIRAGINLVFKAGSDGDDLWVYDPLSTVSDIDPVRNPYPIRTNPEGVSNPGDVLAVGNRLFFSARDSSSVYELWTYEIY